ncbi:MAG TPA: bifunctional serine/threonine-protein kinase/formylglycine-generating enzyme family protein [Polyangiaceae bacterium]
MSKLPTRSREAEPIEESGAVPSSRQPDGFRCLAEDEVFDYLRRAGRTSLDEPFQRHLDVCANCRVLVGEAARAIAQGDAEPRSSRPNPSHPLTLRVGEVIMDRYKIVRFIARGGMGEVYEAHDSVLKETVALKTLVCTSLDDARAMDRLMAEVRLARHVTHANVCRILEFGFHRPKSGYAVPMPFLTMEFLRGETLAEKIARERKLDPDYVSELLPQVVAGLSAIHAAGIVHRDVKPGNMVLLPGPPQRLLLTDFGLARTLDPAPDGSAMTGALVVGTLDYMAPEQLEGKAATTSVDVYALGVVIYEMLTGRKPFSARTVVGSAIERVKGPPPRPSALVPELDPRWDALVAACMALEPQDRFARVEDILTYQAPPPPKVRVPMERLPWIVAGVALASTAIIVGWPYVRALTYRSAASPAGPVVRRPPQPPHRAFTSRGCSEDMVRVQDRFCIDRFEASMVDDVEERALSPFYPPSAPLTLKVFETWKARLTGGGADRAIPLPAVPSWQVRDDWAARAASRGGVVPHGYVSKFVAEAACASAGKRLCTAEEWTSACRGDGNTQFPYGPEYRTNACNVFHLEHPGDLLHGNSAIDLDDPRMNQVKDSDGYPLLRPTGSTPDCKSRWGDDAVYDMVGNLDEWVDSSGSAFYGGFYSRQTILGCDAKITYHPPSHFNYSTGVRCCDKLR